MRNRGMIFWGIVFIVAGLVFLASSLLKIDAGRICWPVGLVILGIWLLTRPRLVGPNWVVNQTFVGDLRRRGTFPVKDEEFASFVGDVDLDLTQADLPIGETHYRTFGFVGDVKMILPASVGLDVSATGFVVDTTILGSKMTHILEPVHFTSENYETAEKKVRLETSYFVGNTKIKQV